MSYKFDKYKIRIPLVPTIFMEITVILGMSHHPPNTKYNFLAYKRPVKNMEISSKMFQSFFILCGISSARILDYGSIPQKECYDHSSAICNKLIHYCATNFR